MKITVPAYVNNQVDLDSFRKYVQIFFTALINDYNGRISFTENCNTRLVTAVFPAANTELPVTHNLGFAPNGYIQVGSNVAVSVFDSTTANTGSILYVQANAAATVKLLIF